MQHKNIKFSNKNVKTSKFSKECKILEKKSDFKIKFWKKFEIKKENEKNFSTLKLSVLDKREHSNFLQRWCVD